MSQRKPQPKAAAEAAPAAPAVTHTIALAPADWFRATWRQLPPLSLPEPAPFDAQECAARLSRVTVARTHFNEEWDWERAHVAPALTPEEARFWLAAMTDGGKEAKPKELALHLARQGFAEPLALAAIKKKLKSAASRLAAALMLPLRNLLTPAELLDLARADFVAAEKGGFDLRLWLQRRLIEGFALYVRPYLPDAEVAKLRESLQVETDEASWPSGNAAPHAPPDVLLAAVLGLHAPLEAIVSRWPDDGFAGSRGYFAGMRAAHAIVFGLGDPHQVERHTRRLPLPLNEPWHVRAWLAHTGLSALDFVRDGILAEGTRDKAEALLDAFARVQAPEAAPFMLELKLSSKAPGRARQWLDEQAANAVAGLLPIAAGRGKLADAALDFLRDTRRRGLEAFLEEQLAGQPPEVAGRVRRDVLERQEQVRAPLDDAAVPDWFQTGAADLGAKPAKPPAWVDLAALPPLPIGAARLGAGQVQTVLQALRKSKLEEPHPLLAALRQHVERTALDDFAWRLFELWQGEGSPSKDKWALLAVGLLGGDRCVLKLTPLLRNWPGQSQHQRAVLGLQCLRTIGTDTALMQLSTIAQKLRFEGLKRRAQGFMLAIATERGLSTEELEDRIVPDLDLDERGSCAFDFGPRRFRFVLGPDMKPVVRDEAGKLKSDLPKPGVKDDPERATAAVAQWKLLKTQVKEVVKVQARRLEQAMVSGRRWPVREFEDFLVRHPLMTNLAQRLVWSGHDQAGDRVKSFRVTEERTYADAQDRTCSLEDVARVGIIHPLHLTAEERAAWGQVLGDYEIIPPFAQLGRRVHTLQPGEEDARELTRFAEAHIPAMIFWGILKSHGWENGLWSRESYIAGHFKTFAGAALTAILEEDGGGDTMQIKRAYFVDGLPGGGAELKPKPLRAVDPVVLSEVLGTLGVLASKGE